MSLAFLGKDKAIPQYDVPNVQFVTVTPNIAEQWLAQHNHGNRIPSKRVVSLYAADMAAGRWRDRTGEPITFDRNGRLQDGQHRLMAVVQSHTPVTFTVMRDTDPDDFKVLNQGKRRTASQILRMSGASQYSSMATAARNSILLANYPDTLWNGKIEITDQQILAFCEEHLSQLEWACSQGGQARKSARIPEAQYAAVAFHVLTHSSQMNAWQAFHDSVCSGEMLGGSDPRLLLRRWASKRTSGEVRVRLGGHLNSQASVATISKAWNYYLQRRIVGVLNWKRVEIPMPTPLPSPY